MLGGDVPDLVTTPCVACGKLVGADDVVWDAWHMDDHRFAAMPYHRACAGPILPPAEPAEVHRRCGICKGDLAADVVGVAFEALHDRFKAAKGSLLTPVVTWRLAQREPERVYVAEHFQCILGKLPRKPRPPEPLPGLPGDTQPPS